MVDASKTQYPHRLAAPEVVHQFFVREKGVGRDDLLAVHSSKSGSKKSKLLHEKDLWRVTTDHLLSGYMRHT